MRLLSKVPIRRILDVLGGYHRDSFGQVKQFVALGKRLKSTEQRLVFLVKCKMNKIFPSFIRNNVRINQQNLFPIKIPSIVDSLQKDIQTMALNQNIKHINTLIRCYKKSIQQTKAILYDTLQTGIFRRILCIFEEHNSYTKRTTKENLQRKYQWLLSKYYKRIIPADSGLITQDHSERVTVINVPDISDNEMSLLALGPAV